MEKAFHVFSDRWGHFVKRHDVYLLFCIIFHLYEQSLIDQSPRHGAGQEREMALGDKCRRTSTLSCQPTPFPFFSPHRPAHFFISQLMLILLHLGHYNLSLLPPVISHLGNYRSKPLQIIIVLYK